MQRLSAFKSRFFWKLFLTYALIFVGITSAVGLQVYRQLQRTLAENLKVSLKHKLELVVAIGEPWVLGDHGAVDHSAEFRDLVVRLGTSSQTRISFINIDGEVIADSAVALGVLDNHSDRPEIIEARKSRYGFSERFSVSSATEMVYLAKSIERQGELVGFARVAWPRASLENDLRDVRYLIFYATIGGIVTALLIAFFLTRRVAVPIAEMVSVCDAMRSGDYDKKVRSLPSDEIGKLGDTLNRLGGEITAKIAQISVERAQLKTMLTGMVEGIIAVDHETRISFCNRAAYLLVGSNLKDCRGMFLVDAAGFDQLDDVARKARSMRELIEEEISIELEKESRLLEVHASYFEGKDATGVIIVLHDITKVRTLEKMRRDFVANVSHEIKTPLTSIKGFVETILAEPDIDEQTHRRFLQKIERNAERLMKLVHDILSLAQIESHDVEVQTKPIDIGVIMRQVISQYEDQIIKKELEVDVLEITKPLIVAGDRESIFQVLDNLYTNAVRYTPQGGRINITIKEWNNFGAIEVKDTGIGIPKKYLGRIFERFYRVDKARSRELGGTGLGLSIVKHLVANMGGTIVVESEVGIGSKFTVSLPLAR